MMKSTTGRDNWPHRLWDRLTEVLTDDVRAVEILSVNTTDAPATVPISFVGRVQGWRNARIELVVTNNVTCSALVSYVKVPRGLEFNEWDALR